jgi:hypothetical protein
MKIAQLTQEEKAIYVGLLTVEQKDLLVGQLFDEDSYFNPILDGNDPQNWIISIEEIEQNIYPEFNWLRDLEMIIFVPVVNPMPFN